MDQLNNQFQKFLKDGARKHILSEEFKKDVEFQLGDQQINQPSMEIEKPGGSKIYLPDHDINTSDSEGDESVAGSFKDPLDDETRSIISNLGKIVKTDYENIDWGRETAVVWTSGRSCESFSNTDQMKNIIKSILAAIEKDSGIKYSLRSGDPNMLFIYRDSMSRKSDSISDQVFVKLDVDEGKIQEIIKLFREGIYLQDLDEEDKYLAVSTNTPGFDEVNIRRVCLQGLTDVKRIMETIFRQKGRLNYILSSYDLEGYIP